MIFPVFSSCVCVVNFIPSRSTSSIICFRFCPTRWIEDEAVASRAITLWSNVVKTIEHWERLSKSKRPQNKSYATLTTHYRDSLVLAKFNFFKYVAGMFQEYLVVFQSDSPLVPFLSDAIERIYRKIAKMFIKKEVLENADTPLKLIKLEVSKKENQCAVELVNLGTATKDVLRKSSTNDVKKKQFKKECVLMLAAILEKIQERSPLKYAIVRYASCLSPLKMVRKKETSIQMFNVLADKLFSGQWISARIADEAKQQFDEFLDSVANEHRDKFLNFDYKKDRLDQFLGLLVHRNKKYAAFWVLCKIVFTLSHGQSAVERGFSVNKELLVENLGQKSLISQRIVYDHMTSLSIKIHEFAISSDLLKSCRMAHQRYQRICKKRKRKRKLKLDEITDVKRRKDTLEACIISLSSDIDKYSIEAEQKTAWNCYRKQMHSGHP